MSIDAREFHDPLPAHLVVSLDWFLDSAQGGAAMPVEEYAVDFETEEEEEEEEEGK